MEMLSLNSRKRTQGTQKKADKKISRKDAKVNPEEAEILQKIGRTEFFYGR